jgi:RNA polymerase sigma-70 factor (ECF subfamily)
MTPADAHPVHVLLAERAWVRSVARHLVRDEASADDLEQDAWVAALESAPAEVRRPRGWLAVVLRRAATKSRRSETRRRSREGRAARPESTHSTAEVLARAEWHERVVRAVLALDEPYRATVLLRWFEGLSPAEVAARTGDPVATVRSRAQRALGRLRARLDDEHGGRSRWVGGVALLLPRGEGAGPFGTGVGAGSGGAVMAAKGKAVGLAALALALVGALGVVAWSAWRGGDGVEAPRGGGAAAIADAEPRSATLRPDASPRRIPTETGPDAGSSAVPPPSPGDHGFEIVDAPSGAPVREASVQGHGLVSFSALPTASGHAVVPAEVGPHLHAWISAAGYPTTRWVGDARGRWERIALRPGADLRVRFRGNGARDLSSQEVRALYAETRTDPSVRVVSELDLTGRSESFLLRRLVREDAWVHASRLRFDDEGVGLDAPLASNAFGWWLVLELPRLGPALLRSTSRAGGSSEFVVDLEGTQDGVRLRCVEAESGQPVAGAVLTPWLEFGDDAAFVRGVPRVADARGEVVLPRRAAVPASQRQPTWWAETRDRLARVEPRVLAGPDSPADLPMPRKAAVRGTVFGADGAPLAGAIAHWQVKGLSRSAGTDDAGRFLLEGLRARRGGHEQVFVVEDAVPARLYSQRVQLTPGETTEVTFGTPGSAVGTETVRGRLTAGGRPLAGAFATLRTAKVAASVGPRTGQWFAVTDGDGGFTFAVSPGDYSLRILLGDMQVTDDAMLSRNLQVVGGAGDVEVDADLPDGAVRVSVRDADGRPAAGAWVAVRDPAQPIAVAGFDWRPGGGAVAGEDGVVTVLGLPLDRPLVVEAALPGAGPTPTKVADVTAGPSATPREVTVRLVAE